VDSKQVSQATTGLIIVVVGLVLLGGQFRMGLDFGRLWPLVLIVIGMGRFLTTTPDGRRGNGAWLLLIGALFLLNNFRILGLGDSWPLFIVAAGLSIMFGGRGEKKVQS
jgi:hypothetical protein